MSSLPETKIKGLERKLKQSEIDFMKLIEEKNIQRVLKLKKTRKFNLITGKLRENLETSVIRIDFLFFIFRLRARSERLWYLRVLYVGSATRKVPRRL